ncbi:MAG: hypothetical protein HY746_06735 [Elusimicrobia bacterium]|nr:hypothetical protein [Elusimicrobiota bacterium]
MVATANKPDVAKNENGNLDKLITDSMDSNKYELTVLAMKWARHLKKQEEFRNLPVAEIIGKAMGDVIAGKVSCKQVKEALEKDTAVLTQPEIFAPVKNKEKEKKEKAKAKDKKKK